MPPMNPQPTTPMTLHNKAPFELQSESPVPPTHLDRPVRGPKVESEQRNEGRIELLRKKAAFAFRLTAVHAPRAADRDASGFSFQLRKDASKRNKPESGIQTTQR